MITASASATSLMPDRRSRPGRLINLLAALGCVLTAQRIVLVAMPWLVLTGTGSPTAAGIVSAAQTAPLLLTKLLAGPLLDRLGAGRVAVTADLVCTAGMLLLAATATPPLWLIATVMAAVGATEGPSATARTALLPEATAISRRALHRGTGLMTTVERAATTVGPALAGLLIAEFGSQRTLFVAAGLFAAASRLTGSSASNPPRVLTQAGYWRQLGDGARAVSRDRTLVSLALMFAVTNWLDQALLVLLFPLWAQTHGDSPALVGGAISAAGATATLTALASAYVGHKLPRRPTYLAGAIISGATRFAVLAAGLPTPAVIIMYAIAGLGSGLINPLLETIQLERIPAAARGRALTLIGAAAWIGIPAGAITGAALNAAVGLTTALWLSAAVYLIASILPAWPVTWHLPSLETAQPSQQPTPRIAIPTVSAEATPLTAQAEGDGPGTL